METKPRDLGSDNIRGILIILVVFGHFLELYPGAVACSSVYLLIYSFHMPAFIFLSGLYSKYNRHNMLKLALLYLLFQFLYRSYVRIFLGHSSSLSPYLLLSTPYWLLWYLPVLLYCQSLLPLWTKLKVRSRFFFLFLSVMIALICGYCPQIGYPFSLSRFLVLLPFFLAGKLANECKLKFTKRHILPLLCSAALLSLYLCCCGKFNAYMLYGSYSYAIGYTAGIRLQIMIIAAVWVFLLLSIAQTLLNRPIPVLSYVGANTLPIYLLHGFAVKYLASIHPNISLCTAVICSAVVIALVGNPVTVAIFNPCLAIKK